jgi:hypothetical protein
LVLILFVVVVLCFEVLKTRKEREEIYMDGMDGWMEWMDVSIGFFFNNKA